MADAFSLGSGWDGECFCSFDGFGAVEHFYGEADGSDVDVGEAKAQPVVVSIRSNTLAGFFGLCKVIGCEVAVSGTGCREPGFEVQVTPYR